MQNKLKQGEALFAEGKIEEAEKSFLEIIEKDPENKEALNNLGVVAFHNQDTQKAIDYLAKSLEIDPFYKDAIFNYSDVLRTLNILHELTPFLEIFIKKYPNDKEVGSLFEEATNSIATLRKFQDKRPSFQISSNLQKQEVRIRVVSPSDFDTDSSRRILWGDHWVKYELEREFKNLGLSVVENDPDVILYLFGIPVSSLPQKTYNMVWLYSHPDMVTPQNLRDFDKIFCLSSSYINKLRAMGYDDVELMIGATSKRPIKTEKKYDIVFVGNPRGPKGRQIITDIGEVPYNFKVWGNGWEQILPPKYIGGRYFDNQKLGELYASSLISINDHHPDMAREGFVAVKIFDILASGGFAISDKNTGIPEIFGNAVPQYESPQHLRELLDFYIAHPAERLNLMDKGRKIALSHTYRERTEQFVKNLKPALEAKRRTKVYMSARRGGEVAGRRGNEQIKVLYVDTISVPHAACNVSGMMKAYAKVSNLKPFDYRGLAAKFGQDRMNQMLMEEALRFCPDIIHLGKSELIYGSTIRAIKKQIDTYVIHFYGDFRWDPQPWVIDIGKYADCTLFSYTDNRILDKYSAAGVKNIGGFWDAGTDPEVFYPRNIEKTKDVVFMGNNLNIPHDGYEKRRQLIEETLKRGLDLHVYGKNWEYLSEAGYKTLHIHPFVTEDKFAEVCSSAEITLGINGVNDIRMYASWRRTVNTMASGGFHLTHYVPGMETVFQNKKHLVWFNSVSEAMDLIEHYLTHGEERKAIAEAGRKEVLARHTWDARIAEMIDRYKMHKAYQDLKEFKNVTDAEIERKGSNESIIRTWTSVWNAKEKKITEQIKSAYNETDIWCYRNVYHNYHTQTKRFEFTASMIRKYCNQFKHRAVKLLDYGCGTGCLEKHLLDISNLHITLADIPSQTFEFAKWRFRNERQFSFIEIDNQDCLREVYDIMICYDVLEHIPEPMPVIQHLTEHLERGGLLFLFFCTSLPKGRPSGHLRESIEQYPQVMSYVHENYEVLEGNLYRKKMNSLKNDVEVSRIHGVKEVNVGEGGAIGMSTDYPKAITVRGRSIKEPLREQSVEQSLTRHFEDILHQIAIGNYSRAVEQIVRHFIRNQQNLNWLQSRPVFDHSGDVVRTFALAFYKVGNLEAAVSLLDRASELYERSEDAVNLYKSACLLPKGEYDKIMELLSQIPRESSTFPEVCKLLAETTRRKDEAQNRAFLESLAKKEEYDESKFYILGMKPAGHDAHVSIVDQNGNVVFDAEEERFVRVKHTPNIPLNSLIDGMLHQGIHPDQIRYIAFFFSSPEYTKAAHIWEKYYRENGFSMDTLQMVRNAHGSAQLYRNQEKYFKSIFRKAEVIHVKHHMAHCAGAFYSSPFPSAAILSIDGRGEFETVMLARGNKDHIEELEAIYCPHSLGTLYQTITYWFGLGARQEGKTMGLSSYGAPNVYYQTFRDHIIDYDSETGHFEINREIINPDGIFLYDHTKFNDIFDIHEEMDTRNPQPAFAHVAAALQRITEEVILCLAKRLRAISGEEYLCMTGGVALNSVTNGKVLKANTFKDVSMHPAAHDGGTGLGAALYVYYNHVPNHKAREKSWWVMQHPYLGSEFPEEDIRSAIKATGFPLRKHEDAPRFAAEKLAEGKIVGWYQERMEVGPRALGNRSILGDPRVPTMKDEINKRVKFREYWRPFAPSVLKEDCGIYFDSEHESPYMLFVYNTKKEMIDRIPAVCHVDGTARVHTVDRDSNARYYSLIEEFKKLTGIGLVLNTSLNVRGEPIVCTPKEAIDCFLVGGMDYMILGDYILDKDTLPGSVLVGESSNGSKLLNIPTRTGRINGFINIDVPTSNTFDDVKCDPSHLNQFQDNSIDLIHSHYYLQTLTKDRISKVLTEWKRVLKNEGSLIVEVPKADHSFTAEEELEMEARRALQNRAVWRHVDSTRTPLTFRTLKNILEEIGFVNVQCMKVSAFHPEKIGCLSVQAEK